MIRVLFMTHRDSAIDMPSFDFVNSKTYKLSAAMSDDRLGANGPVLILGT